MLIGTAGHIDHGKTTLVQALTGINADRLPEEKRRGITLDLGYAYTPLSDGRVLGFVDVPGHEKLIHNMLAGATAIDFALLVIAADDGPMPQTREHLELLELLGLTRGAVALTKTDAVSAERRDEVQREIAALLAPTGLAGCPLFAVSAVNGDGIAALRDYLQAQAQSRPVEFSKTDAPRGRFRLAIDRAFTLKGVGTVVTGTALAGRVALEDALVIAPPGYAARVRGLHVQDRKAEFGQAGQRCAIALKGDFEKSDLHRGMWLVAAELAQPLTTFQAQLRVPAGQVALKHQQSVHVHLGTEDIVGRVALLEGRTIEPGETGLAEIQLARETLALNGDRFILRDAGAQRTVAGGRVLDIFPPRRHKRTPERLAYLHMAAQQDVTALLAYLSEVSKVGVDLTAFARGWNLMEADVEALCAQLGLKIVADKQARMALSASAWEALQTQLLDKLAAEHERAPDMIGVESARLQRMLSVHLSTAVFSALCAQLQAQGALLQTRAWWHLPSHSAQLSHEDQAQFETIKALLDSAPFNPPRVRDLARLTGLPEFEMRRLCKRLSRVGELYPVAHDHYYTAEAVAQLAELVYRLSHSEEGARIATLRNALFSEGGGGRKIAQQLLEFFDRVGYTRRLRDVHVLRHPDKAQSPAWSVH